MPSGIWGQGRSGLLFYFFLPWHLENNWHTITNGGFQQLWHERIIELEEISVPQLKFSRGFHGAWLRDKGEASCFYLEWQNCFWHIREQGAGFQTTSSSWTGIPSGHHWHLPWVQLFKWTQNLLVGLLSKGIFCCLFHSCSRKTFCVNSDCFSLTISVEIAPKPSLPWKENPETVTTLIQFR